MDRARRWGNSGRDKKCSGNNRGHLSRRDLFPPQRHRDSVSGPFRHHIPLPLEGRCILLFHPDKFSPDYGRRLVLRATHQGYEGNCRLFGVLFRQGEGPAGLVGGIFGKRQYRFNQKSAGWPNLSLIGVLSVGSFAQPVPGMGRPAEMDSINTLGMFFRRRRRQRPVEFAQGIHLK